MFETGVDILRGRNDVQWHAIAVRISKGRGCGQRCLRGGRDGGSDAIFGAGICITGVLYAGTAGITGTGQDCSGLVHHGEGGGGVLNPLHSESHDVALPLVACISRPTDHHAAFARASSMHGMRPVRACPYEWHCPWPRKLSCEYPGHVRVHGTPGGKSIV